MTELVQEYKRYGCGCEFKKKKNASGKRTSGQLSKHVLNNLKPYLPMRRLITNPAGDEQVRSTQDMHAHSP